MNWQCWFGCFWLFIGWFSIFFSIQKVIGCCLCLCHNENVLHQKGKDVLKFASLRYLHYTWIKWILYNIVKLLTIYLTIREWISLFISVYYFPRKKLNYTVQKLLLLSSCLLVWRSNSVSICNYWQPNE